MRKFQWIRAGIIAAMVFVTLGCEGDAVKKCDPANPIEQLSFYAWDGIGSYDTAVAKMPGKCPPTLYLSPVENGSDDAFESNVKHVQDAGATVWMFMSATPGHDYLKKQIGRIVTYNADHEHPIIGMAIDIEPWAGIAEQNSTDNRTMWSQYLDELTWIGDRLHENNLSLSVAIPFWLSSIEAAYPHGRPINYEVVDRADEVVVMDYTTDLERFKSYAKSTLEYAEKQSGKRVKLALELTQTSEENVSFYGHESSIQPFVKMSFSQSSFAGYVLHTLDAFAKRGMTFGR